MNYELITPSISTCELKIYNENERTNGTYISDWHIHREYEIILILSGKKIFYINNVELELNVGDIIFVDSNIPHKTATPINSSAILLQFNISSHSNSFDESEAINIFRKSKTPYVVFKAKSIINKKISTCISKIQKEYLNQKYYFEYFIKSYLFELTAILYRNEILTDQNEFLEKEPHLVPVFKYISSHYNEHISLSEISNIANLHSSYFCKIFKSAIGISFVEYLNLVRINKAKQLLQSTQMNITEISYEVGFSSVSDFIKTFKKYNYCSPYKYKFLLQK